MHAKDPAMREKGALAVEALHRQVLPFILRRVKEQVLKDLPPKIIQDVFCDLSPLQTKLYEEYSNKQNFQENLGDEEEGGEGSSAPSAPKKEHVFLALQYLKKVCNHPKLVDFEGKADHDLKKIAHSGKLVALRELLLQCGIGDDDSSSCSVEGGEGGAVVNQHRALVFFQHKSMINIVIEDLLRPMMPSVTYLRMDGSVPANSRQDLVQKFNQDPSIDLMLLSTSVGEWKYLYI